MEYFLIFLLLMAIAEFLSIIFLPVMSIIFFLVFAWIFIKWFQKFRLRRCENKYYNSKEFFDVKQREKEYIENCNNLNNHVEELKNLHIGFNQLEQGKANYYDTSGYHYTRPEYTKHLYGSNVYNCSRSVCDNARLHPFKYVCKYFDIKPTEENLEIFEFILGSLETASEGIKLLTQEKERILKNVDDGVPEIIKKYAYENFQLKMGFERIYFGSVDFPKYTFLYVSPGGNASTRCDVVMDIENLNGFINYLSEKIKFKESVAGQRSLMTSALRKKILVRDHYTCKICGVSISDEPHLLLEIDHILPLSKGGMTTEDNLQTLCWRCNRKKGAKTE